MSVEDMSVGLIGGDVNQTTGEHLRPHIAHSPVGLLNANRAAAVADDLSVNNREKYAARLEHTSTASHYELPKFVDIEAARGPVT
jgi:hypothetical protein